MGLFGRKKEKVKPEMVNISGEQLLKLINKAVSDVVKDVEARCYIVGPEIMFDYNDAVHFIGIKYDKKRAKKEKRLTFSRELMSVYIDKDIYQTLEKLYDNAIIDGMPLKAIKEGIIVSPEFKTLL